MKMRNIATAKNPDLRASAGALLRAARLARQTAIQTNTNLIIVKDGKLIRIPALSLRQAATNGARNKK